MNKSKLTMMAESKLTIWLSNKYNLIGIYALCSFCMGVILYKNNLTFTELLIVYLLTSVCSFVVYLIGISRGMIIYSLQRKELDSLLEKLTRDDEKDDK